MQLFSFCIHPCGSAYFGGALYLFFIHAVQELYAYAVIGWMAVVLTLCALFFSGRGEAGITIYWVGADVCLPVVFIFSAEHFMNIYVWRQGVPLLTLGLFVAVMVFVVKKFIKMGGL